MSAQRFTPEFKEETVKQVRDRGYGLPEVAARLGVSANSLYKWVKAASPDRSEQQSTAEEAGCRGAFWHSPVVAEARGGSAQCPDPVRPLP